MSALHLCSRGLIYAVPLQDVNRVHARRVTEIGKRLHRPWIEELQEELGDGFYLGFVGASWPLWWHATSKARCADTMEIGFGERSIAYSFV